MRRVLRPLDRAAREGGALWAGAPSASHAPRPPPGQGIARDGKERRGARAHGRVGHLVSLVRRDGDPEGAPLAQTAVADTSNEITAAPALRRGRTRRGQGVTVAALLAQQARARQIRQPHGHSLRGIKANQPEVGQAIARRFAERPAGVTTAESMVRPVDKGPGRLAGRTRETRAALADWLEWPGGRPVPRRTGRRVIVATGEVSEEVTDGMTSLSARQANAAVVERLGRGHGAIANRVHSPRDVGVPAGPGDDAGQASRGNTPQAVAALRNAVRIRFRAPGGQSVADGVPFGSRHDGAFPDRALCFIRAIPG